MNASPVITVLNLKGGVGKTHATWLLSAVAQERSLPFLANDTDTQGNLSGSFLAPEQTVPGVEAIFNPGADAIATSLIRKTAYSNIDVLPSSAALARFDEADQQMVENWQRSINKGTRMQVEFVRQSFWPIS